MNVASTTFPATPRGLGARGPRDGAADRFAHAERHSRRVRRLKFALPLLALAAAGGFAFYSWLGTVGIPQLDLTGTAIEDGKLVMANPKLDGFTSGNLPYSLKAMRAIQDLGKTSLVRLEAIDARLPLGTGRWADVKAPSGSFDNAAYSLSFDSELAIATNDGLSATLSDARVELGSGSLRTAGSVEIRLKGSQIASDGLTVSDRGKTIVFEKRVRVTVDPKSVNLDQEPLEGIDAGSQ